MMNATMLRRHSTEKCHIEACRRMMEDEERLSQLLVKPCDAVDGYIATRESVKDVPRPEKWVWSMTNLRTASSFKDYELFCETNALSHPLPCGRVLRDESDRACHKMVCAMSEYSRRQDQKSMMKAVYFSMGGDGKASTIILQGRWIVDEPRVQEHEGLWHALQDY